MNDFFYAHNVENYIGTKLCVDLTGPLNKCVEEIPIVINKVGTMIDLGLGVVLVNYTYIW